MIVQPVQSHATVEASTSVIKTNSDEVEVKKAKKNLNVSARKMKPGGKEKKTAKISHEEDVKYARYLDGLLNNSIIDLTT